MNLIKFFLKKKVISRDCADGIVHQYNSYGGDLDDIIMERGRIDEKTYLSTLAAQNNTRFVTLERMISATFSDRIINLVPDKVAKMYTVFPIAYDEGSRTLTVISPDVNNIDAIMQLERCSNVRRVKLYVARSRTVKLAGKRWYDNNVNAFYDHTEGGMSTYDSMLDIYNTFIPQSGEHQRQPSRTISETAVEDRSGEASKQATPEPAREVREPTTRKPEPEPIPEEEEEGEVSTIRKRAAPSQDFKCLFCHQMHPAATDKCPVTKKPISAVQKLSQTVLEGKYQIKEMVGEGGMGIVYEGEHIEIGKRLAIKFLNPSLYKSREAYERFKREAKAAAMIDHKNIVDVSDIGTNPDGIPYIIMEFLSGEDLATRLEELRRIQLDEAWSILAQMLEAIGAVHSCGVVHRDLKPENIFLARQSGGSEIVKVLDFGISRLTVNVKKSMKITREGRIYGTPHYISPEQAEGNTESDHRVDIYAAGTIFYEMLLGKPPFDARSYPELLVEIIRSPVPDLKRFIPNFPPAVMDFIRTAMAKDPDERFHSAQEMLRELGGLHRDMDVAQGPRTSSFHLAKRSSSSKPLIKEVQVTGEETGGADIHKKDTADLAVPKKKGPPPPPKMPPLKKPPPPPRGKVSALRSKKKSEDGEQ